MKCKLWSFVDNFGKINVRFNSGLLMNLETSDRPFFETIFIK